MGSARQRMLAGLLKPKLKPIVDADVVMAAVPVLKRIPSYVIICISVSIRT